MAHVAMSGAINMVQNRYKRVIILAMLAVGLLRRRPANYSDLRAVRHAKLAHDLPNMKFDSTFTHRQPARNDLVRIATAQKFEDRSLPRC